MWSVGLETLEGRGHGGMAVAPTSLAQLNKVAAAGWEVCSVLKYEYGIDRYLLIRAATAD